MGGAEVRVTISLPVSTGAYFIGTVPLRRLAQIFTMAGEVTGRPGEKVAMGLLLCPLARALVVSRRYVGTDWR